MRHTFISLARGDGARSDVLRWITHGPTGDIVDLYRTLPWETLCTEVMKLRSTLRSGNVVLCARLRGRRLTAAVTATTPRARTLSENLAERAGFEPAVGF